MDTSQWQDPVPDAIEENVEQNPVLDTDDDAIISLSPDPKTLDETLSKVVELMSRAEHYAAHSIVDHNEEEKLRQIKEKVDLLLSSTASHEFEHSCDDHEMAVEVNDNDVLVDV